MKYYNTIKEEQETLIHFLYDERVIEIYSSKPETIRCLIENLGQPTVKHRKNKTYWSGATWKIDFLELDKIRSLFNKELIIDPNIKNENIKEDKKVKFEQISFYK